MTLLVQTTEPPPATLLLSTHTLCQWFVGRVDGLEVASMMAESLVLPPDLSREEPAASNIHLLKPTKHDLSAILHGGSMTITNTVDAAQPRARCQQVDSLSSPRVLILPCPS